LDGFQRKPKMFLDWGQGEEKEGGGRERAKKGWAKKYYNEQLPWIDVVSEWKTLYYHYCAIYEPIWCNLEHQVITVSYLQTSCNIKHLAEFQSQIL